MNEPIQGKTLVNDITLAILANFFLCQFFHIQYNKMLTVKNVSQSYLPTIIHSHVLTVQQYSITCVYMYAACADYCKLENFEKLYLSECDAITVIKSLAGLVASNLMILTFDNLTFIYQLSFVRVSQFTVQVSMDHLQETLSFLNCLNLILHSDLSLSSFLCGCNATQTQTMSIVTGNPLMMIKSKLIIHTNLCCFILFAQHNHTSFSIVQ